MAQRGCRTIRSFSFKFDLIKAWIQIQQILKKSLLAFSKWVKFLFLSVSFFLFQFLRNFAWLNSWNRFFLKFHSSEVAISSLNINLGYALQQHLMLIKLCNCWGYIQINFVCTAHPQVIRVRINPFKYFLFKISYFVLKVLKTEDFQQLLLIKLFQLQCCITVT